MTKKLLCVIVLMLALVCIFVSCNSDDTNGTTEVPDHTHDYDEWVTVTEATCTAKGSKERYCSCGEMQTSAIPMLAHEYGEWRVVKAATATEKGSEERACSCGQKETRELDMVPVVTTVTATEWKNALDFSKYTSITVTGSESGKEDGIAFDIDATVKYYGGVVYISYEGAGYDGEDSYIAYREATLEEGLRPFSAIMSLEKLHYFLEDLEETDDLGYSQMTYSEPQKSYSTITEYGRIHTFWFENGTLVKYSYEENGQAEYLNGTYTFTNQNNTERFNIPTEEIAQEYQDIVNSISASAKFYYYDDGKVYCDASDIKSMLNSKPVDIVERYYKSVVDGEMKDCLVEIGSMSSANPPISIWIRDGKLKTIEVGFTEEDAICYYAE